MYNPAKNRQYYISLGICPVCKKQKPEQGYKLCKSCRERLNDSNRKSRAKHRIEYNQKMRERRAVIYEYRVVHGICTRCGKAPAVEGHRTCRACHPMFKSDRVGFRINAAPGICYQCGEPSIEGMRLCRRHYRLLTGKEYDD